MGARLKAALDAVLFLASMPQRGPVISQSKADRESFILNLGDEYGLSGGRYA
jgi:hypothetical protein